MPFDRLSFGMPPTTRRNFIAMLAAAAPSLGGRGSIGKNGRIIKTWGDQAERRDVLSSAKPVLTTLLFFAIQEKKIAGLSARIADFGWDLEPKDRAMTFAHLTSMTSGYGRPEAPGEAWAYNDYAINLYQKTVFDRLFAQAPEDAASRLGNATASGIVSGPTFAKEVAHGLPTAVTVASADAAVAEGIAQWLRNDRVRVYTSQDRIGVELGGAVKNIMAIATGISDGLGYGANARAALITRGLAEMRRLGAAMGGKPETFMGLAGLGDLVLTCTDNQSRNRQIGLALGKGRPLHLALADLGQVAEGVTTARTVQTLARWWKVDMPITEQVARVLFDALPPQAAVEALLGREPRAE